MGTDFNFTWDAPTQNTTLGYHDTLLTLQGLEENIKLLHEQKVVVGGQIDRLEHNSQQLRNFAAWAIPWIGHIEKQAQNLAQGSYGVVKQLHETCANLGSLKFGTTKCRS